jgi:predicted DNA-binding transcriptional regulator YafY
MAKKSTVAPKAAVPAVPARAGVTAERFVRLVRLVESLAGKPQPRQTLMRRLKLDVRGFYRDLELVRTAGVSVTLADGRYGLDGGLDAARSLLPFPDPHLTLGEAVQLAKGRTTAHRKMRELLEQVRG